MYAGTIGGTLLSVFGTIGTADVVKTAICAAIGAVISFVVSATMRKLCNLNRKGRNKN